MFPIVDEQGNITGAATPVENVIMEVIATSGSPLTCIQQ